MNPDLTPATLAQMFHEAYERLAPSFGYRTREASAKPWSEVPENNRALMTATCGEVLTAVEPLIRAQPAQGQLYQVTWMDRDGAYEVRSYAPEGIVIGTQDGVLMVATRAQDPTLLLAIPAQRLVSAELV